MDETYHLTDVEVMESVREDHPKRTSHTWKLRVTGSQLDLNSVLALLGRSRLDGRISLGEDPA